MNLYNVEEGKEYVIKRINISDEELEAFGFGYVLDLRGENDEV